MLPSYTGLVHKGLADRSLAYMLEVKPGHNKQLRYSVILDKETKYLSESDKEKFAILKIHAPWLADYVTDVNNKVPLNSVYRIYMKLKKTNDLEKLKALPKEDRDLLVTTNEGRKIILNDEYNYILQDILNGNIHTRDVLGCYNSS